MNLVKWNLYNLSILLKMSFICHIYHQYSALLSPIEATPGVLCPLLGTSAQERHRAPVAGQAEGNKDHEGPEAPFL